MFKPTEILEALKDRELTAVVFVRDYLQLQFDSMTMTINVFPIIEVGKGVDHYGETNYRNRLCEQIDKRIVNITVENRTEMIISFGDESRLTISNHHNAAELSEVVVFESGNGPIVVW